MTAQPNDVTQAAVTQEAFTGDRRMAYEMPSTGTSLTRYIVRRLHKTSLLVNLEADIKADPSQALVQFGIYAAAGATSWGPARYQPTFDPAGTEITESDPTTGAVVTVRRLPDSPHYTFGFEVALPEGGQITGQESITGTTVGLRGLGMPAPSRYDFCSADSSYTAYAIGTINSELAPSLMRPWQIRGYGTLQLADSLGQGGTLTLRRDGLITIDLRTAGQQTAQFTYQLS